MNLVDKLDDFMERNKISRAAFARNADIPYTTLVNFYEKGTENVKLSTLRKIADYMECSLDYLVDDTIEQELGLVKVGELVSVPIVGRVSCGNGVIAIEEVEGRETIPGEWVQGGEHFFMRAKGDSMSGARIYEGDLLLIRKQPYVENGEIAAVLKDDEILLKRVYINDGQLVLQSENPNYQPIFAPPEKVTIMGKLKRNVIEY